MNREKLGVLLAKWREVEYPNLEREEVRRADMRAALLSLLEALLEGAPDVGHVHGTMTGHWASGTEARLKELHKSLVNGAPGVGALYRCLDALLLEIRHGTMAVVDHGPSRQSSTPDVGHDDRLAKNQVMLYARINALAGMVGQFDQRLEALEAKTQEGRLPVAAQARLVALEAYRAANEEYVDAVHGSLKALEVAQNDLVARLTRREKNARAIWARLNQMRVREQGGAQRGLVLELLDALLGPPDVGQTPDTTDEAFAATMRSGQPWAEPYWRQAFEKVTATKVAASVKRGATPCPVCESTICRGDVDARGCDTRAATRKAIQP